MVSCPGHTGKGPVARGHIGKGPVARGHTGRGPAARGHTGKGPAARGHTGRGPAARGHTGKGPAARGHTGKGPAARGHTGKGPATRGHTGKGSAGGCWGWSDIMLGCAGAWILGADEADKTVERKITLHFKPNTCFKWSSLLHKDYKLLLVTMHYMFISKKNMGLERSTSFHKIYYLIC